MHFLIGSAILIGLIAFGFGENVARSFIQTMFVLLGFAVAFAAYDIYSSARYQAKYVCVSTECLK